MAGKYLSLEEAAQKLGITPERLRELRDLGEVHGYRDGASWKFKPEEIERVADELGAGGLPGAAGQPGSSGSFSGEDLDSLLSLSDSAEESDSDELDASSILVTEDAAPDPEKDSSTVIGKEEEAAVSPDSDLKLAESGSAIELGETGGASSGDSIKLADGDLAAEDSGSLKLDDSRFSLSEDSLKLADSGDLSISDSGESGKDDSDFELQVDEGAKASGSDEFALSSDEMLLEGSDKLEAAAEDLALSDDDDMLLGEGSGSSEDDFELSLGDSGIDLSESSESVFVETESDSGSSEGDLELSDDSLVVPAQAAGEDAEALQPDEEFMLAPSEELLSDDSSDSGSQVIALEDSESGSVEFGEALVVEEGAGIEEAVSPEIAPFEPAETDLVAAAAGPSEPEYSVLNVLSLLIVFIMLAGTGVMLVDIIRNMWTWQGNYAATSWLMDAVVSTLQLQK